MVMPDQKAQDSERRWYRRSLWGLILIVPLSLFTISYGDYVEMSRYSDLYPTEVAAGEVRHYGGSDWQFYGLRKVEDGIRPGALPKGAVPVIARFLVEVGDPNLQDLWLMCAIRLTDKAGRSWAPSPIPGMRPPQDNIQTCVSAIFSGAVKGTRMVIEERFLVPAAVADELRPTLGVYSERPYYLRFDRTQ
jgi:hypothetical protein